MPGYVIHLAVAKKYLEANNIKDKDSFLKGVIDPDLLDKKESHYGENSSSPNFEKFLETHSLDNEYDRGYFLHLLTDFLFYNQFLDGFSPEIYSDYNKLNQFLVEKYNITIPDEIKSVVQFDDGTPTILDKDRLCQFIEAVAKMNFVDLKELKKSLEEKKSQPKTDYDDYR